MKAAGLKIPGKKSPLECPSVPEMTSARIAKNLKVGYMSDTNKVVSYQNISQYTSVET